MQRKSFIARNNSTRIAHSSRQFDADRSLRALEERVAKLEKAFESQECPIEEAVSGIPTAERKRPGPVPVHFAGLISDRNRLVEMLEWYWPEFEPLCWPKPNLQALKELLQRIVNHQQSRPSSQGRYLWVAKHLLDNLPALIGFLASDRFRRDPRQIANAFAGLPKIGTWRSLKLCQASPRNDPIGHRAIKSYIRRKHTELYGRLLADHSIVNFATALKTHRTKDTNIKGLSAEYLLLFWDESNREVVW